ncbi:MAG TPA: nuclear transport factor 2 family protein [Solirubrobacteraceae bacterium]|jgi:ketosteroid isomerase-like protein
MSSANLDLVRSIYADWERGDFSASDWADPDIEHADADGPLGGQAGDLDRIGYGLRQFLDEWEDFRLEADELREIDEHRVLALDHRSGRGKTSGLELGTMRTEGARLFHIRNGKITRIIVYFDRPRFRRSRPRSVGDAFTPSASVAQAMDLAPSGRTGGPGRGLPRRHAAITCGRETGGW